MTVNLTSVECLVEPAQAVPSRVLNYGYRSANITGDIDNAMLLALLHCVGSFYCNADPLPDLQGKIVRFMHEMVSSSSLLR